jgi:thymidine kinase
MIERGAEGQAQIGSALYAIVRECPPTATAAHVRSLSVTCQLCRHEALMNVDAFDDATPVPAFGPRMICTGYGIMGAFARPNWQERAEQEN